MKNTSGLIPKLPQANTPEDKTWTCKNFRVDPSNGTRNSGVGDVSLVPTWAQIIELRAEVAFQTVFRPGSGTA